MENSYLFENLNPGTYTATVETENGCLYTEDVTIVEPPLLTVTAAVTIPLTCTDGEITIYPEGGTPPYFFFINAFCFTRLRRKIVCLVPTPPTCN